MILSTILELDDRVRLAHQHSAALAQNPGGRGLYAEATENAFFREQVEAADRALLSLGISETEITQRLGILGRNEHGQRLVPTAPRLRLLPRAQRQEAARAHAALEDRAAQLKRDYTFALSRYTNPNDPINKTIENIAARKAAALAGAAITNDNIGRLLGHSLNHQDQDARDIIAELEQHAGARPKLRGLQHPHAILGATKLIQEIHLQHILRQPGDRVAKELELLVGQAEDNYIAASSNYEMTKSNGVGTTSPLERALEAAEPSIQPTFQRDVADSLYFREQQVLIAREEKALGMSSEEFEARCQVARRRADGSRLIDPDLESVLKKRGTAYVGSVRYTRKNLNEIAAKAAMGAEYLRSRGLSATDPRQKQFETFLANKAAINKAVSGCTNRIATAIDRQAPAAVEALDAIRQVTGQIKLDGLGISLATYAILERAYTEDMTPDELKNNQVARDLTAQREQLQLTIALTDENLLKPQITEIDHIEGPDFGGMEM